MKWLSLGEEQSQNKRAFPNWQGNSYNSNSYSPLLGSVFSVCIALSQSFGYPFAFTLCVFSYFPQHFFISCCLLAVISPSSFSSIIFYKSLSLPMTIYLIAVFSCSHQTISDISLSYGQFDDHSYLGSNSVPNFFSSAYFCISWKAATITNSLSFHLLKEIWEYPVLHHGLKMQVLPWIWRDFILKPFKRAW